MRRVLPALLLLLGACAPNIRILPPVAQLRRAHEWKLDAAQQDLDCSRFVLETCLKTHAACTEEYSLYLGAWVDVQTARRIFAADQAAK